MSGASLLVRGASIVDGTGAPRRQGDVLVRDGRIAAMGQVGTTVGATVLDGDGLVVAPGFIDMHSHSDLAVLTDPEHLAKTTQGVTTEVVGQDGLSYAPAGEHVLAVLGEQLAGWNGLPGPDVGWAAVGAYLEAVDAGAPVNVAYLVPQGTVRMSVLGTDDVPADDRALAAMRHIVDQGLREGAVGMSSGLTYTPGMFATTDELVALAQVVAAHGGFYAPHQRSYGRDALGAYAEMVEVAARSRCALHLTHATMNFAENAGRAGELLALVDQGLAAGLDITLDTYPYLPGSTTLAALLPSWASAGGPGAILDRLGEDAALARIRHDLEVTGSDGCHGVVVQWETLQVSGVREGALSHLVGQRLSGFEMFVDLLVRDRLGTTILQHVGDEDNVRAIMRHRLHCAGSDGLLVGERPHPRAWGTFARYLGHYVRDQGVLGLEECVAHLTSRPARRLGLGDRGVLREGAVGDLVLFDPDSVDAGATYDQPRRQALGIPHVVLAGQLVVRDGQRTQALPGRSIRGSRPSTTTRRPA